jgi:hypothetical protein
MFFDFFKDAHLILRCELLRHLVSAKDYNTVCLLIQDFRDYEMQYLNLQDEYLN